MNKMSDLMQQPQAMQSWFEAKKREFNELAEDWFVEGFGAINTSQEFQAVLLMVCSTVMVSVATAAFPVMAL
jgi:hypothetical protein